MEISRKKKFFFEGNLAQQVRGIRIAEGAVPDPLGTVSAGRVPLLARLQNKKKQSILRWLAG